MNDKNSSLNKIMARVVLYERKSIAQWLIVFYLFILGLITICGLIGWLVLAELRENETLDLLSLARKEEVTIIQHWTQQLLVVWHELPGIKLSALLFSIGGILVVWLWTKGKRHLIRRKKLFINLYHQDHPQKH